MFQVILPKIGAGMTEGTVVEWLKREGDTVKKGDPIVKIEGEKVIFDVEAQKSGTLSTIMAKKGTVIPIGAPLAVIVEEGEIFEKKFPARAHAREARILASPAAKRIAKELGIDLATLKGSGPEEMIMKKDLPLKTAKKVIEPTKSQVSTELVMGESIPVVGMRKTIAERLTSSYRTAPQVAISIEVNMSNALNAQKTYSDAKRTKIPMNAFLVTVVAKALKDHPIMNSTFEEDKIRLIKNVNIGIAIAIDEGLIVPILHNADQKSLVENGNIVTKLIQKAKTRSLSIQELQGGTFTVSNLGSFGIDIFTPIINPPQAAILGVGKIAKKLIVFDKSFRIASMITLTLVFDHRIVDGAKAAQFLKEIKELLEEAYPISQYI